MSRSAAARSGSPSSLTVRLDRSVPILVIPEGMNHEALRNWLGVVLPEHLDTIAGRTTRLDLGTRPIVLFDLRRLVHFLQSDFGIEITGVYARDQEIHRFAERELKLKLFPSASEDPTEGMAPEPSPWPPPPAGPVPEATPAPAPTTTAPPAPAPDDGSRRTLPVYRTLRSGNHVQFDGDVHVFGDVNPGAQVVATGSILILGALKGVAHAGAHGDDKAFILAFDMRPTQLRIGRNIAIPPDAGGSRSVPEVAIIVDQQVRIDAFRGRIPTAP